MSPGGKLTFCAASWKEQHHSLEVQLHFYDLDDDNSSVTFAGALVLCGISPRAQTLKDQAL